jgi:hypothetical protein
MRSLACSLALALAGCGGLGQYNTKCQRECLSMYSSCISPPNAIEDKEVAEKRMAACADTRDRCSKTC